MIKAWAKFTAAFWEGFAAARAESRPPLAAALDQFFQSAPFKAAIASIIRAAFADGVTAEKARIEAIMTAPGAAHFPEIAMDLVRGPATSAQAIQVLERAEADAATRAATIKSNMVESANAPTRH
jgi:hypothetical protein